MQKFDSTQLLQSLQTGFISKTHHSINELAPTLLVNNYHKEKKILSSLVEELESCEAFDFSVAFINNEGLAAIKQTLDKLAIYSQNHPKNPVKGRILTTNYLNFTQPSALRELMQFPNIEIRAYTKGGFHPKGYIFKQSNYYSMIIGSANLTASALTMNQEWSVKFLSCTDGQIVYTVREEFEQVWNEADNVNEEWLAQYSKKYDEKKLSLKLVNKQIRELRKQEKSSNKSEEPNPIIPAPSNNLEEIQFEQFIESPLEFSHEEEQIEIVPNSMQEEAMVALHNLREQKQNRALLIAATGTGKTYLSIFDVKQENPRKVLYVAHRDMILDKSEKSFKNVFPNIKMGFLNGSQKDIEADYLFASVFTLAKEDTLKSFKKDEFDYIIVDEVHHAGAESYKKVIDYFTPKFLLGLTATPERTDGFDIFSMFHNNIAYEIRLQKAMEEDLLCPFHYYGLSDLTVDGEIIDEKTDFNKLVCDERIKHIERSINLYRNFEYPVKGLIFCSRVEEAKELSEKLNKDGYCTKYLTGEHSDIEREKVIQELESDENPLQYIISVDIFNEGVDIPSINQVVMLRPTQSAIIFVQQLGRGLRKFKGKSYVSVIDFIGNYENNFFIPIALYGDNSYNKDNLRKVMNSGSSGLPGTSTVQITEVARQRIYDAINNTSFTSVALRKKEYEYLKMKIGRIPTMMDFVNNGSIDPRNIMFKAVKKPDGIDFTFDQTYYEFVCKMEKCDIGFNSEEMKCLKFISKELSNGIRLHEILLLKEIIENQRIDGYIFKNQLKENGITVFEKDLQSCLNIINGYFYMKSEIKGGPKKRIYSDFDYISFAGNKYFITEKFSKLLENTKLKKEIINVIEYALYTWTKHYSKDICNDNMVLYEKYTRKDICRLLNWETDCSSTVYGYKTETSTEEFTCPIFVTYDKSEGISETTKYEDGFIDNTRFSWMSRSRRTSTTEEVAALIDQPNNHIKIMLFVKKNDCEGSDFYYMGQLKYNSFTDTTMKDKDGVDVPVVNIQFDMEHPVPQNLYNYLVA